MFFKAILKFLDNQNNSTVVIILQEVLLYKLVGVISFVNFFSSKLGTRGPHDVQQTLRC